MNGLDHLANLAEIFAAVLVIVSLIYVGVQIKQNTSALRSNPAHNTSEGFSDLYLILANSREMADIFARGTRDYDSLDRIEKVQFFAYFQKFFRTYENAYYQYKRTALEQESFEGLSKQLEMVSSLPGVRRYWRERKNWYNDRFQVYIDEMFQELQQDKFQLASSHQVQATS